MFLADVLREAAERTDDYVRFEDRLHSHSLFLLSPSLLKKHMDSIQGGICRV